MTEVGHRTTGCHQIGFRFQFSFYCCLFTSFTILVKKTNISPFVSDETTVYTWDGTGEDKQCLRTNYWNN